MWTDSPGDNRTRVRYAVAEVPVSVPSQKPAPDKPNPKQGIGKAPPGCIVSFSSLTNFNPATCYIILSFLCASITILALS